MDFNRYFTFTELNDLLESYQRRFPNLCRVSSIGESHEGRPILLVTLTDFETGAAETKPALWADGNLHATEVAGTTVVLSLIDRLLEQAGSGDERCAALLKQVAFYLVPRANPDGAERALAESPEFLRSGVRRYPDTETDRGIHWQDIDGDGRILQMRFRDPHGDWKISSLHPQLMEKRAPNDNDGEFYRLFPEGLIEDFDGFTIKTARPKASLDFNRNFPYHWRPEGEQYGAGPYPASEPEVRALVEFFSTHPNINCALCYHTFGGMLLRPYDDKSDEQMETNDLWVYELLGKAGADLTGYVEGPVSKLLKYHPKEVITGTADSWLYDFHGIFAWTVELWDIVKHAGVEKGEVMKWFRTHAHTDDLQILNWYKEQVPDGDGYVDWYAFEHPQLGKIELGGWNKIYSWRNPPHRFMQAEAAKNVDFALFLGEILPRLTVHHLSSKPLGGDLHRLTLVVENTGYLPTCTSSRGRKVKAARQVRVELSLPTGASLLTGKQLTELGHLEGRSNKFSAAAFSWVDSNTDNRSKVEWTVQAPNGTEIEVSVMSDRAGSLKERITLS